MQPYSNATLVHDGYFAHPSSFMETVRRLPCAYVAVSACLHVCVCLSLSLVTCAVAAAVCADGDVHRPVRHGATVALRGAAIVPTPLKRETERESVGGSARACVCGVCACVRCALCGARACAGARVRGCARPRVCEEAVLPSGRVCMKRVWAIDQRCGIHGAGTT